MPRDTAKISAYLETLKDLRAMIAIEYAEGGWLPPVREICERLNVSDRTYNKAVNCLVDERTVKSYPRKGIYVRPEFERVKKIGFVIGNGQESPFWAAPRVVGPILSRLIEREFFVHQIQASPLETLPHKLTLHGISCLLWFPHTKQALKEINKIHAERIVPQLVIPLTVPSADDEVNYANANYIETDFRDMSRKWAKFLAERKHRRFVYIAKPWFANFIGLETAVKERGIAFTSECVMFGRDEIEEHLPKLIELGKLDCIISEGGDHLRPLFKIMSMYSREKQPELLVRQHERLKSIYRDYPNVNLVALGRDSGELLMEVVDMIDQYLQNGTPLSSRQVADYEISFDIKQYLEDN